MKIMKKILIILAANIGIMLWLYGLYALSYADYDFRNWEERSRECLALICFWVNVVVSTVLVLAMLD